MHLGKDKIISNILYQNSIENNESNVHIVQTLRHQNYYYYGTRQKL